MTNIETLETAAADAERAYDAAFEAGEGIAEAKAAWQQAQAAVDAAWEAQRQAEQAA
jgi:hypothetical protein